MPEQAVEKMAVLGLDGLGPGYLSRMLRSGEMPFLARLVRRARIYRLLAFPPVSPPSWSSIMTGVNPGKHGIFSFDYVDRTTWTQRLYTALDLGHPRIHEMLAFSGVPSVMVNTVPAFPLLRVRGTQVLNYGFFTPKPLCYPEHMRKYLALMELPKNGPGRDVLETYADVAGSLVTFVEEAIQGLNWRLFWMNVSVPDVYLHHRPDLLTRADFPEAERRVMRAIDRIISLLEREADTFMVVSDHGFSVFDKVISINDILFTAGLVKPATGRGEHVARGHKELIRPGRRAVKGRVRPLGLRPGPLLLIRKAIRRMPVLRNVVRSAASRLGLDYRVMIDMGRSAAFMPSSTSHGIYVRERGLRGRVMALLRSYRYCLAWVKPREEVFWGPYVGRAPDIMVCPHYDRGYKLSQGRLVGEDVVRLEKPAGGHHPVGVLLVKTDFHLEERLSELLNYVVAPLAMALLGVPLPHDTDALGHLRALGLDVEELGLGFRNYLSRWLVIRRLKKLRARLPESPEARGPLPA